MPQDNSVIAVIADETNKAKFYEKNLKFLIETKNMITKYFTVKALK